MPIDRDIILLVVGSLIGLISSLATLLVAYFIEGMRLRRRWQREDQRLMREKQEEIRQLLLANEQKISGDEYTNEEPDAVEEDKNDS